MGEDVEQGVAVRVDEVVAEGLGVVGHHVDVAVVEDLVEVLQDFCALWAGDGGDDGGACCLNIVVL